MPRCHHSSLCAALARRHAVAGIFAKAAEDRNYHLTRADAFADAMRLPPDQLQAVLNLSERFPAFSCFRGKMVEKRGHSAASFQRDGF